jgi:hypothetical protein
LPSCRIASGVIQRKLGVGRKNNLEKNIEKPQHQPMTIYIIKPSNAMQMEWTLEVIGMWN